MSRTSLQSSPLAGQALVKLKNGVIYRGHARYDGRVVTIDGRQQVLSTVGGERIASYRARRRRTVPLHLVREIIWE